MFKLSKEELIIICEIAHNEPSQSDSYDEWLNKVLTRIENRFNIRIIN